MMTWMAAAAMILSVGGDAHPQRFPYGFTSPDVTASHSTKSQRGGASARLAGAPANSLLVNPSNIVEALARVPAGVTLVLAPGEYGEVWIKKRNWSPSITIDARQAKLKLRIYSSSGINVSGGSYVNAIGKAAAGYAIVASQSSKINLEDMLISNSTRGIVLDRVQDVNVSRVYMNQLLVDGINISSSQRVTVTDSRCSGFVVGIQHPDCIQLWSRPEGITSDVKLLRNVSEGPQQGFTAFNHVRNGVDDGGFDRVVMKKNLVNGSAPQGVALYSCRDCDVSNNRAITDRVAKHRVSINVLNCTRCVISENIQGDKPGL